MKQQRFYLMTVALFLCLSLAGTAWAIPFREVFLGESDDQDYFTLAETSIAPYIPNSGNNARFTFDLSGTGGYGRLRLGTNRVGDRILPDPDETSYDPAMYRTPHLAWVDFHISDLLFDVTNDLRERVRINIEGGPRERQIDFTLDGAGDSAVIRIDLVAEGLLDGLGADGRLLAATIAPNFGGVLNTFILDRVELYAEASPVPEPATMLLLGSGLVGMAVARRRLTIK